MSRWFLLFAAVAGYGVAHAASLTHMLGTPVGQQVQKMIGGKMFTAVVLPYKSRPDEVALLRVVGKNIQTLFRTQVFGENLHVLLLDVNHDGGPELYWSYETIGNLLSTEEHHLFDSRSKKTYAVSVNYLSDGTPGEIMEDASNKSQAAAPFRRALMGYAIRSPHLKDNRSLATRNRDSWIKLNYQFFSEKTNQAKLRTVDVSTTSSACPIATANSINDRFFAYGMEYVNAFKWGLFEIDRKKSQCRLLWAPRSIEESVDIANREGDTLQVDENIFINLRNHTVERAVGGD